MDAPAPPPPQPAPAPPIRPVPHGSGMGCLAKGCLILTIVGVVLLALCVGGLWFILDRAVRTFTAPEPAQLNVPQFSSVEVRLAEAKASAVRQAIQNNQETTVEFSATDLNALIANDPDFRAARGKAFVRIEDSLISLDLRAPLFATKWNRLRGRWFNGHVKFGFSYVDDDFRVDLKSAEGNGHTLPDLLFSSQFSSSFNRSFNESFRRASRGTF